MNISPCSKFTDVFYSIKKKFKIATAGLQKSLVHFAEFFYNFFGNFGCQLRNNCFQVLDGLELWSENLPHCVAPEKSQGCKVGAVRGGGRGALLNK